MQGWLLPSRGPSCSLGIGLKGSLLHGAAQGHAAVCRGHFPRPMGCMLDASPDGLQGEMRSAAEVSSDGKLFREIKEQVGNRAAK